MGGQKYCLPIFFAKNLQEFRFMGIFLQNEFSGNKN